MHINLPGLNKTNAIIPRIAPIKFVTYMKENATMLILPFDLGSSDAAPV